AVNQMPERLYPRVPPASLAKGRGRRQIIAQREAIASSPAGLSQGGTRAHSQRDRADFGGVISQNMILPWTGPNFLQCNDVNRGGSGWTRFFQRWFGPWKRQSCRCSSQSF